MKRVLLDERLEVILGILHELEEEQREHRREHRELLERLADGATTTEGRLTRVETIGTLWNLVLSALSLLSGALGLGVIPRPH